MLKTLHGYITKDLVKITLMAALAFTMVMTVFAIIEPLRKQGLATSQVLMLFSFTLPVTLSLTLPFAALFAATMVYGRFSQDRELLACRASGIATGTVLVPAVALGVVITIISLVLTNFVSPIMARNAEKAVVKNIKKIAYHKLKKEGLIALNGNIIHASNVRDEGEEDNGLVGVIAGQFYFVEDPDTGKKYQTIRVLVASNAFFETFRDEDTGKHYASVVLADQVGPVSNAMGAVVDMQELPLNNIALEPPSKEKSSFYDWPKLIATYNDPTLHGEIHEQMADFKRSITQNRIMHNIADTINSGKEYSELQSKNQRFYISAGKAVVKGRETLLQSSKYDRDRVKLVMVRVVNPETGRMRAYLANSGKVESVYDKTFKKTSIAIELTGNVRMKDSELSAGELPATETWKRGQIPMPKDQLMEGTTLTQLFRDWQNSGYKPLPKVKGKRAKRDTRKFLFDKYTTDNRIRKQMYYTLLKRPYKVKGDIVAEMHSRIAVGISCMFLVAMGAALGIMFKGGNVLVAFVLSVIPAAVIMVLIMMGKKMIANPDSNAIVGIISMWGGNFAMMIVDLIIYARICRR